MIKFTWDTTKNKSNIAKHQISFENAKTVFFDFNARIISDPEHSTEEERFLILGLSLDMKLLVVSHCYKDNEKTIRIISARKATTTEQKYYFM